MGFSRKRGRPATLRNKIDKGTLELRQKKARGITAEPLDVCLSRKIINEQQHAAGLRLRWLYTLRFGSPDIGAYQFERLGASGFRQDSEEWLKARQDEYNGAISKLMQIGAKTIVMNVCIFNQRAAFLRPYKNINSHEVRIKNNQLAKFKEGMELLVGIF
jgi:hypothetical protein